MDFFKDHAVAFALICGAAAVLYGLYLTYWLLSQPAGNERMREISGAVQEGAAAYLKKQYTTIAVVAVVPFIVIGFYNELGWGAAFGFIIGAFSVTGLAGTLANDLVYLAGNAPFILLIMGAITSFIFGMGMTVTACYI